MHRIRIVLPKRESVHYRNLDILHDALVNGWTKAGAHAEEVIGMNAKMWHFASLGWHSGNGNHCHTLVVGTPDPSLARFLGQIDPAEVAHSRVQTAEAVNFSKADILPDPAPVGSDQMGLGILMLSPLAISRRNGGKGPKWHRDLRECDLSGAVNFRLSRLAGRKVDLRIEPDRLYLRINPKHDTLVRTKVMKGGREAYVIGMEAPMVIQGSDADLELAWYAGIGEKNRNGFGCIGLAERGIGR